MRRIKNAGFFNLLLLAIVLTGSTRLLGEPAPGNTLPAFYLTKSFHPQNILHYEVRVTPDCRLRYKDASPFKIFWVMGEGTINSGQGYREAPTKTELSRLNMAITPKTEKSFEARFSSSMPTNYGALPVITITLNDDGASHCSARAWVPNLETKTLGPPSLFDQINLTIKGVIPKVKDLTLYGFSENGRRIERRFSFEK